MTENLAVVVDGPYPNATAQSQWDEFPEWITAVCDEDLEPVGKVWYCDSYDSACEKGTQLSEKLGLELIIEASPWW